MTTNNSSNLKDKSVGGVAWNAAGLVIDNGLQLFVKLLLARLLLPEVFGIIGFATVFIGMVQVFCDLGMSAALIQRKEKDLRLVHYHTAYRIRSLESRFSERRNGFIVGFHLRLCQSVETCAAFQQIFV